MNTRCAFWLRVAIAFLRLEHVRGCLLYRACVTFFLLTGTYAAAQPPSTDGGVSASPPLRIRVLAKEHPTRMGLFMLRGSCDGKALHMARGEVSLAGSKVLWSHGDAGTESCAVLSAPDGVALTVGSEARNYECPVELRSDGAELLIDALPELDRYVASVLTGEADALPNEAMKAQAIVSRSWALANRGRHADAGYDLCDLTHCQLYRGDRRQDPNAQLAAEDTENLVLVSVDGGVTDAAFHSSCGGATSSSSDIFGSEGLRGVSDLDDHGKPFCEGATDWSWNWDVDAKELAKALGAKASGETRVVQRDSAGRALALIVLGKRISGRELLSRVQKAFDYQSLRSVKFSVTRVGDRLRFTGRGVGHGVGFCQAGAAGMARRGASYEEILRHYFPESVVRGSSR